MLPVVTLHPSIDAWDSVVAPWPLPIAGIEGAIPFKGNILRNDSTKRDATSPNANNYQTLKIFGEVIPTQQRGCTDSSLEEK